MGRNKFPSEKDDWKKIEKSNLTIAVSVLYAKKKKICPKHNPNCEKQVILLLMHYPAVNKLSVLLRGITSKHQADFYCLNCLHSFRTEYKLNLHKNVCENKGFCNVVMPAEDTKLLEFSQYQKSDKAPFVVYLECSVETIDGCKNNPER